MNISKKLSLVGFLLILLIIITSCKKDDSPTSSSGGDIIGTWVLTKIIVPSYNNAELSPQDIGTAATFVIRNDGTFTATVVDSSGTEITTGNWTNQNGVITMNGSDGSTVVLPYTLSGNTLTVETNITIETLGDVIVKMIFTKQ